MSIPDPFIDLFVKIVALHSFMNCQSCHYLQLMFVNHVYAVMTFIIYECIYTFMSYISTYSDIIIYIYIDIYICYGK